MSNFLFARLKKQLLNYGNKLRTRQRSCFYFPSWNQRPICARKDLLRKHLFKRPHTKYQRIRSYTSPHGKGAHLTVPEHINLPGALIRSAQSHPSVPSWCKHKFMAAREPGNKGGLTQRRGPQILSGRDKRKLGPTDHPVA